MVFIIHLPLLPSFLSYGKRLQVELETLFIHLPRAIPGSGVYAFFDIRFYTFPPCVCSMKDCCVWSTFNRSRVAQHIPDTLFFSYSTLFFRFIPVKVYMYSSLIYFNDVVASYCMTSPKWFVHSPIRGLHIAATSIREHMLLSTHDHFLCSTGPEVGLMSHWVCELWSSFDFCLFCSKSGYFN